MARSVELWVGKTDDAKIPDRVRLRVWLREKGICHLSGRKIQTGEPWDLDHRVALINGGTHSEDNLFPALRDKHRKKTAEDVREKAATAKTMSKHIGIKQTGKGWATGKQSKWKRKISGEIIPR